MAQYGDGIVLSDDEASWDKQSAEIKFPVYEYALGEITLALKNKDFLICLICNVYSSRILWSYGSAKAFTILLMQVDHFFTARMYLQIYKSNVNKPSFYHYFNLLSGFIHEAIMFIDMPSCDVVLNW
jgi:hypothetical protein